MSMVGVAGIFSTMMFMFYRALGSYAPGAVLTASLAPALRPAFTAGPTSLMSPSALVLVSMAATAYLSHFNAPDFYNQLADNTTARFKKLSVIGFGLTFFASAGMMGAGFLTFGGASAGVILNNYSTLDIGATICRLLTVVSVIGSYPFVFGAMRDSLLRLAGKATRTKAGAVPVKATTAILACVTGLASVLKNAGFVVSFNGAIMGSAIIYLFPPVSRHSTAHTRTHAQTNTFFALASPPARSCS